MFDPFAGIKPKLKLIARRRSRCWQCDKPMERMGLTGHAWWCKKCAHIVTYDQARLK